PRSKSLVPRHSPPLWVLPSGRHKNPTPTPNGEADREVGSARAASWPSGHPEWPNVRRASRRRYGTNGWIGTRTACPSVAPAPWGRGWCLRRGAGRQLGRLFRLLPLPRRVDAETLSLGLRLHRAWLCVIYPFRARNLSTALLCA